MGDPRKTGISAITGKVVFIRHASPLEREIIAEELGAGGGGAPDVATADIVVAQEGDRRIGFAVLARGEPGDGTACLTLYEHWRRRGIGGPVLQHLLEHAKVKKLLAGRESARYLGRAGFRRVKRQSPRRTDGGVCAGQGTKARPRAVYEHARLTHG